MIKVLNLYAGIGGNRKLWENVEVTAVENEQYIADAYKQLYPDDTVIIGDAHQYLLDHYSEFDFIWSSPPCPTHSRMRRANLLDPYKDNSAQLAHGGGHLPAYPDMRLYQEIIFLKHHFKGKYVVENVEPYYRPLIHPTTLIDRHPFWSNFYIPPFKTGRSFGIMTPAGEKLDKFVTEYGIVLPAGTKHQRKLYRNAVNPKIGLHILNASLKEVKQGVLL